MRTKTLCSFIALLSAAGLAACGVPPEGEPIDRVEQAAQPGMTPVEQLPLIDKIPEGDLPPGFDERRGWSEYRLPDGKRALFLTRGESVPEADPGVRTAQSSVNLNPVSDTWFEHQVTGAVVDYGRSCELRVNNANTSASQHAVLRFAIPGSVTCTTITDARLTLVTAQLPAGGNLVVAAQKPNQGWNQGGTGLAGCSSCSVTTAGGAAFNPPTALSTVASVNVTSACTRYQWTITSLVQSWCGSGVNNGVLMTGTSGAATVNFHSLDSSTNRPLLTIVY